MDCIFSWGRQCMAKVAELLLPLNFFSLFPLFLQNFPFLLFLSLVSDLPFFFLFLLSALLSISPAFAFWSRNRGRMQRTKRSWIFKNLKVCLLSALQLTTSTFYLFQWLISKSDGHLRSNSIVHNMWTSGNTTKLLHLKISLQTNKYEVEISI